jgi:hypothetical protein
MGMDSLSSISSCDRGGNRLGEFGSSPPLLLWDLLLFLPKPKNAPPRMPKSELVCGLSEVEEDALAESVNRRRMLLISSSGRIDKFNMAGMWRERRKRKEKTRGSRRYEQLRIDALPFIEKREKGRVTKRSHRYQTCFTCWQ